jgi:hypothetical protein
METRRIRRLARRRVYRNVALACSLAALGLALGMALPRSTIGSLLVFVAAASCALIVVLRDGTLAPIHGLHRVIRLPLRTSLSATLESFWSRLVGTLRAVVKRTPKPVALVLDEPDEEAEAWWGRRSAELSDAWAPLLAEAVPPVPELEPEPAHPALEPAEPAVVGPVLAAPMRAAHVPADDAPAGPSLVEHVLAGTRRHVDAITKRFRRDRDEAGVAT